MGTLCFSYSKTFNQCIEGENAMWMIGIYHNRANLPFLGSQLNVNILFMSANYKSLVML